MHANCRIGHSMTAIGLSKGRKQLVDGQGTCSLLVNLGQYRWEKIAIVIGRVLKKI